MATGKCDSVACGLLSSALLTVDTKQADILEHYVDLDFTIS